MSRGERKAMITRDAPELSLSRQCRLLSIGRSSFYYAPRGESPSSLALMRRIDELFMKYPFYGSRQMVRQLRRDGVCVGRHRVRRLMRLIGLEAIYQAPRTSVPHPMHRIYPYLLKGMARVWCADITYIPVQRGFLYLVAIMDWAPRHVLSWRLSNTMDAGFCAEALGDALARYGQPEIFNTDQGSQFTSLDFTGVLKNASIRISMDGRGRCMDNIFIERLWRSLKYEAVYLHELTDGFHAERVIGEWIGFYNTERPHSSLDGQTPAEAYGAGQPVDMMDKARALPTSPQAQGHPLRPGGPRRRGRQHRALQEPHAADPGRSPPPPLRQGAGPGARISRRPPGRLPRTQVSGALPRRRRNHRRRRQAPGRVTRFDATEPGPVDKWTARQSSRPDHFPTGPTTTTEAVNSYGT